MKVDVQNYRAFEPFHDNQFSRRDAEMLHKALVEWCQDRHIGLNHPESAATAVELADLFDLGVQEADLLRDAIASK